MAYDIHIQPVPPENVVASKCMEFGFTSAVAVDGLQSLVNRWIKYFLTPVGSDPLHPDEGTEVRSVIHSSNRIDDSEVQSFLETEVASVNTLLQDQDIKSFRDSSESLQDASIVKFKIWSSRVDLWVRIINGDDESTIAPLTVEDK